MICVNLRRLCVCYILLLKTFSTFAEEFPNCVTHGTGVHRPSEWSVEWCASKFGPDSINGIHKKSLLAGHLKKWISFNLHAASMPENDSACNFRKVGSPVLFSYSPVFESGLKNFFLCYSMHNLKEATTYLLTYLLIPHPWLPTICDRRIVNFTATLYKGVLISP